MSLTNTYRYQNLTGDGSLRLIKLKPATSTNADLHCELVEKSWRFLPQYEAVSYVWGDDKYTDTLYLVGGYLTITKNLSSALRRFRLIKTSRMLWVDAVCINQSDNVEKSSQVGMMAKIYKRAKRVIAWLGEDSSAPLDVSVILDLSNRVQKSGIGKGLWIPGMHLNMHNWIFENAERATSISAVIKETESANFQAVYGSKWFTRMWIVQEALLSKQLVLFYGSSAIYWPDFMRAMLFIYASIVEQKITVPNHHSFINYAWSLVETYIYWKSMAGKAVDQSMYLHLYMCQFHPRNCVDDRDRVFALKGLVSRKSIMSIIPRRTFTIIEVDYDKTVAQVYTTFARRQMLADPQVLYDAGLWSRKSYSLGSFGTKEFASPDYLPSWVPDYRKDATVMRPAETRIRSSRAIDRSDRLVFHQRRYECFGLIVEGRILGVVTSIRSPQPLDYRSLESDENLPDFFSIRQFCIDLKPEIEIIFKNQLFPSKQNFDLELSQAISGDTERESFQLIFSNHVISREALKPLNLWNNYKKYCVDKNGSVYRDMEETRTSPGKNPNKTLDATIKDTFKDSSSRLAWAFSQYLQTHFRHYSMIMAKDGYAGLAPIATEIGDHIVLVSGLNVPFIFRSLRTSSHDWVLIGRCNTHIDMEKQLAERYKTAPRREFRLV